MLEGLDFITPIIIVIIVTILITIGAYFLVDWLFISDDLITKTPLVPEIRETCINGICDTVYIYKNIK